MLSKEQLDALNEPLNWSRVKERKGPRGRMLPYLEGYDVIDRANRVFGYGEWGYEILNVEFVPVTSVRTGEVQGSYYTARIRLTVRDCMPITEEGLCPVEDAQNGDAVPLHDTARKGAITDALKRALRCYGEQFGNRLYDTEFIAQQKREATQRTLAQRPNATNGQARPNGATNPAGNGPNGQASSESKRPAPTPITQYQNKDGKNGELLSAEQLQTIRSLAEARRISNQALETRCKELFGVSTTELNPTQAGELISKIKAVPTALAK